MKVKKVRYSDEAVLGVLNDKYQSTSEIYRNNKDKLWRSFDSFRRALIRLHKEKKVVCLDTGWQKLWKIK